MMKRMITVLLALLLCVGLLAACGGEKDEGTQPAATLPTLNATAGAPENNGTATENVQATGGSVSGDTKEQTSAGQTVNPGNAPATTISTDFVPSDTAAPQTWPNSTDPDLTYPSLTDPETSEAVPSYDDSDEDLPGTSTEYQDDTDEDLP